MTHINTGDKSLSVAEKDFMSCAIDCTDFGQTRRKYVTNVTEHAGIEKNIQLGISKWSDQGSCGERETAHAYER